MHTEHKKENECQIFVTVCVLIAVFSKAPANDNNPKNPHGLPPAAAMRLPIAA